VSIHTWTIDEVCTGVFAALSETFPDEFWVRGEIQSLSRSTAGHLYFDLIEPGAAGRGQDPKLAAVAFRGPLRGIEAVLRKVGSLELVDGIEVRVRGRVEFYPPQGRVQFIVNAIDPRHTLGQLSADRDRVLRLLAREGLLDRNADLNLTPVPLRIGLVTSDGSAAYNDFVEELRSSRYGFRITLADARVQGSDAESTLVAAIAKLSSMDLDVIAIVRGGGAKGDLLAFDKENVAVAVAKAPIPVVVGIGHETDRSVVDVVAHQSLKTPTACAVALIELVRRYAHRLDQIATRTGHLAGRVTDAAAARLESTGGRLLRSTRTTLAANAGALGKHERMLARNARTALSVADRSVNTCAGRAAAATAIRLRQAESDLILRTERLPVVAHRRFGDAVRQLNSAESLITAVHPHNTLARGYSITRDSTGKALRTVDSAALGETITTDLIDGRLTSRVTVSSSLLPDTNTPEPKDDQHDEKP